MKLIDADELKKAMDGYWGRCQRIRKPRNGETAVFLDVMATVEKQPTIDTVPVPVRHGRWVAHTMSEITGYDPALSGDDPVCSYSCSVCGADCYVSDTGDDILSSYCPNCGARMDAEVKENG